MSEDAFPSLALPLARERDGMEFLGILQGMAASGAGDSLQGEIAAFFFVMDWNNSIFPDLHSGTDRSNQQNQE